MEKGYAVEQGNNLAVVVRRQVGLDQPTTPKDQEHWERQSSENESSTQAAEIALHFSAFRLLSRRGGDGFHLPALDLIHFNISAFAEQADAEFFGIISRRGDGRLAVVGKDLDQILVNEDAKC